MATKTLSIRLAALDGKKVEDTFNRIGKSGERAFDKISRSTKPSNSNLKAVDATARALNGVFRQAVGLVAAYAGIAGVMRGVGFIVNTNREFERLTASLKTVTGSAEGAADAFAMIERFALNTPFNVENITDSFIRLKSVGIDASAESLEAIGNIASLMGADITQASNAVANAVTGEFEMLKRFGIVARTEGEQVRFIFQGTESVVAKTGAEISKFLINLCKTKAAGAMAEQIGTLNGIISNVQDNMSRLARSVGQGGLTDALKDISTSLKEFTDTGDETARAIGESLGDVVRTSASVLGFLARNADLAVTAVGGLVVARVASAAFTSLNATIAASGTIALLKSVSQISAGVAVQMAVMEGATKLATVAMVGLRSALAFVGGPAGLVVLAGFALYELASGHDAAAKAAKDHSAELDELRKKASDAKGEIQKLEQASRAEQLFHLEKQKRLAEENIADITKQLQVGPIGGFWDQLSRYGKPLQFELRAIRHEFLNTRLSADEYVESLFKLARKYPSFGDQAAEVKEQVLALKAAELAAKNAATAMDEINNPKPQQSEPEKQGKAAEKAPFTPSREQQQAIDDVKKRFMAMDTSLIGAINRAKEWKAEALKGLDETADGYDNFKAQVNAVFNHMITEAKEKDLQASKRWQDGSIRALQSVASEEADQAKQMENIISGAFQGMEDSLVSFVKTGKLDFKSLTDSIISDLIRMQIQSSITGPLSAALSSFAGSYFAGSPGIGSSTGTEASATVATAHTGGVIGADMLKTKAVNPAVFASARKFHRGGLVSDEVPIIAKKGEAVFTPGQMSALGGAINNQPQVKVNVNVQNHSNTQVRTESSRGSGGELNLEVIIEEIEGKMARNVSRGEGLAPTMERRYGLNPAVGSYR